MLSCRVYVQQSNRRYYTCVCWISFERKIFYLVERKFLLLSLYIFANMQTYRRFIRSRGFVRCFLNSRHYLQQTIKSPISRLTNTHTLLFPLLCWCYFYQTGDRIFAIYLFLHFDSIILLLNCNRLLLFYYN